MSARPPRAQHHTWPARPRGRHITAVRQGRLLVECLVAMLLLDIAGLCLISALSAAAWASGALMGMAQSAALASTWTERLRTTACVVTSDAAPEAAARMADGLAWQWSIAPGFRSVLVSTSWWPPPLARRERDRALGPVTLEWRAGWRCPGDGAP